MIYIFTVRPFFDQFSRTLKWFFTTFDYIKIIIGAKRTTAPEMGDLSVHHKGKVGSGKVR